MTHDLTHVHVDLTMIIGLLGETLDAPQFMGRLFPVDYPTGSHPAIVVSEPHPMIDCPYLVEYPPAEMQARMEKMRLTVGDLLLIEATRDHYIAPEFLNPTEYQYSVHEPAFWRDEARNWIAFCDPCGWTSKKHDAQAEAKAAAVEHADHPRRNRQPQ